MDEALSSDKVDHYPVLARLRQALQAEDWPAVQAFFDELPPEDDPSVASLFVAEAAGVEDFLRRAGGGPLESPLAASLLAERMVMLAWDARGTRGSGDTTREQFAAFHRILNQAEALLSDVVAEQPDNSVAWTARLHTARGLQMGIAEAQRRYAQTEKARPNPFRAQLAMAQQLCPKWGGSFEALHAFARQCAEQAPPGALNAVVVAEAHNEHMLSAVEVEHMRRAEVVADLRQAYEQSIGHPEFRPVLGWVQAASSMAYALRYTREVKLTAACLSTLGNRVTDYPWASSDAKAGPSLKACQISVRLQGGWR